MRRLEFLINLVRRSTDNTDVNAVPDWEIIEYFNDGVKAIQALIHSQNFAPDLFLGTQQYSFVNAQREYTLPSDIYSTNSLMLVEVRFGDSNVNEGFRPVKRITDVESSDFFGYFVRDNKIVFALSEQNTSYAFDSFRVTYFRKLKRFDKRWATVSSVTPGSPNTLTITAVDDDLQNVDDIVSIVDASGTVIQAGLQVVSYSSLPTSFTFTGLTAGIANGQYVVMGDLSSTHTELPESVQPHLIDYVRQRLYTRQNYGDADKQMSFTQATQQNIINIFSNKSRDAAEPPITDTDYLVY